MTIPVDAVYYENGEPYVYTYSDGKVWQKFIEAGIFDSDILEVKSGLSMDDMVVTTWSSELYDGAEVRLKGETTQDDRTCALSSIRSLFWSPKVICRHISFAKHWNAAVRKPCEVIRQVRIIGGYE